MRSNIGLLIAALAGQVAGQSSAAGTCSGTTTISSVADATALANCGTVKGTIVIADGVPDNLKLDGIENIETLTVQGISSLKSLALPVIRTIDKLILEDLPNFEILKLAASFTTAPVVAGYQLVNLPKFASYPQLIADPDEGEVTFQQTAITNLHVYPVSESLKSLVVTGNSDLVGVFSNVTKIDNDFTLTDNDKLRKYWGFPKLESVGGVLEVRGTFSEFPLPNIQSLNNVILESNQEIAHVCNTLQDATASDGSTLVIKGTLTCNGQKLTPGAGGTSDDSSSGSSSGLSSGAQIGIGIGIGGAALIIIALLVAFFIRKRRASKQKWPEVSTNNQQVGAYPHSTTPELPSYPAEKRTGVSSSAVERHELEQPAPPTELPANGRSPSPLQMGQYHPSRFREIESP